MINAEEFKRLCVHQTADQIVDEVLLTDEAVHVSRKNQEHLSEILASAFSLGKEDIHLRIVGSAKLGFSISEKRSKEGIYYPRYRAFSSVSDIDTAIVSPKLFRIIWDELCIYAHGQPWMPWNSRALGDYMVYGWLRPDYFPRGQRIQACDTWWDQFRKFSRDLRFNRRSVRGGLFYSTNDLKRYQRRAVIDCINIEKGEI